MNKRQAMKLLKYSYQSGSFPVSERYHPHQWKKARTVVARKLNRLARRVGNEEMDNIMLGVLPPVTT